MTAGKIKAKLSSLEGLVAGGPDLMKSMMKEALQEVLESEMTEHLGASPGTPQAYEEKEHARMSEQGDRAPDAGRLHLPERDLVPAADPGPLRRDPRDLAGRQPLPEHGVPCGTEEGAVEDGRLIRPR